MRVEFVSPYEHNPQTGIGRYLHTMVRYLSGSIDVAIRRPKLLLLADQLSSLRNLSIGIEGHVPGSIVHFPQIMGCAMMLYRPYHPSVATVHDLGFLELPEEWEKLDPIARWILRLSSAGLKRVDKIMADSEFTRQGIIKRLGVPAHRVVTIHPGIDHELFRPVPDAREILIDHYPRLAAIAPALWLLCVGSELSRKTAGTHLHAGALIRAEIPDSQLIKMGLAGGDSYRCRTLHIIDELRLADRLLIFEGVPEDQLTVFCSAADAFATVSRKEGMGFPVVDRGPGSWSPGRVK